MIEVKREFNNGLFDCLEIYDNEHKIYEKKIDHYWNTDENHPISIAKSRRDDYVESDIPVEVMNDEELVNQNVENFGNNIDYNLQEVSDI